MFVCSPSLEKLHMRRQVNAGSLPQSQFTSEKRSLLQSVGLSWLANELQGSICPHLPRAGIIGTRRGRASYVDAANPKSDPQVCFGGTLQTELSLQLQGTMLLSLIRHWLQPSVLWPVGR